MQLALGILIPFVGTILGSLMVFVMKKQISFKLEQILASFAAGVMIAASIWSLIIPSMEMAKGFNEKFVWVPAVIGFSIGILFLLFLDFVIPHLHAADEEPEGPKSKLKKTTMLVTAVTLHNIPEGLAVGVVLAGAFYGSSALTMTGALALSIGIAIQNFPEGAIISMPLKSEGMSKFKSFIYGTLSGVVEPIGALLTICLTRFMVPILPVLLSFAAGAMIYVVVEELIPEANQGEHTNIGVIGVSIGFVLMMILDIALG